MQDLHDGLWLKELGFPPSGIQTWLGNLPSMGILIEKSSINGFFFPKLDYQRVSDVNGDPILKFNRGPKCHFQLPPQIPPEASLFPEGPPDLLRKFTEDHQTTSRQDGVVQGEGRILCGGTDQNNGATLAVQQESVLE